MPRIHTRAEDLAHAGAMIKRGWVRVAEQDGQVTGFSAHDAGEVNALYVAQAARGRGVGSELLKQLQVKQPQLGLWTFAANTLAQAFYLRHGFVEMRRTDGADNDEKLPDIWYVWQREAG